MHATVALASLGHGEWTVDGVSVDDSCTGLATAIVVDCMMNDCVE